MSPENALEALFKNDGYLVLRDAVNSSLINDLQKTSNNIIKRIKGDPRHNHGNLGVIQDINFSEDAYFSLITNEIIGFLFKKIGISDYKYWCGYLISKELGCNPTYWHQDWVFWDNDCSYKSEPYHVNLMFYLSPTNADNGGLRILPRSHKEMTPTHRVIGEGHAGSEPWTKPEEKPELFMHAHGEVTAEVQPGDVLIMDARTLHATHKNTKDASRLLVILEFLVNYDRIPSSIRSSAMHYKYQPLPFEIDKRKRASLNNIMLNDLTNESIQQEKINRRIDLLRFQQSISKRI